MGAYRVLIFVVLVCLAWSWGCSEDVSREDANRVAGKTPVVQPEEVHGGKTLDGSPLPPDHPADLAQSPPPASGQHVPFTDPETGRMFAGASGSETPAGPEPRSLAAPADGPLHTSRKLILVVASDWNASRGELTLFGRDTPQAPWKRLGNPSPCTLGRNGLAWGRGLTETNLAGPRKKEGDGRTPAGLFSLPLAFGYDSQTVAGQAGIRMPYLELSSSMVCVTDADSTAFNTIADSRSPRQTVWTRQERMVRDNDANRLGLFIGHNLQSPQPGAGSCVLLDIQPNQSTGGSVGCPESLLREILAWIDPASHPVIAILPRSALASVQSAWGLP